MDVVAIVTVPTFRPPAAGWSPATIARQARHVLIWGENGGVVSGVAINVLGPLEVRRDGALVPIEGLKRRQLLAVLVAARGAEVSVDRLGEALWEDEPPESVRATLQSHVSRLRRSLAPDPLVRAGGGGYAIDVDRVDFDAIRFEDLADGAGSEQQIPALERALGLWRGPAFGEFAELPIVRGEALRLEELRLTVTEQLIEARLDAGDESRTVAELEALVAAHPLRERFWRQLMLALYRVGRQAEALRRCAQLRTMLRDELGLSLSPAAQALEAQIARRRSVLAAVIAARRGGRRDDAGPA